MTASYFAKIAAPRDYPRVRHAIGVPPELTGERDDRVRLPWPRVVIMSPGSEGGVNLVRLAADGAFAGDTWHQDDAEAREQALYEFGDSLGDWETVPDGVSDPVPYVLGITTDE